MWITINHNACIGCKQSKERKAAMIVGQNAKYLSSQKSSFKDKNDGRDVTFYKACVVPTSDNVPINLTISQEVYGVCQNLKPYDDVYIELEIAESRGYLKVRCTYVGSPVNGDVEY